MRVFVTGGSGFIGIRLVRSLVAAGHEVIALSRSGESSALIAQHGAEVLSGDLTDSDSLAAALSEARPSHVAHLAAEIATQRNKHRIQEVNVDGTEALVAACRELDLSCFLFLSTVVRGAADGETFTEDDAIPANTAYGLSKQRGDEIVMQAHEEWGLPSVILRPSHVYGPEGWFTELVGSRSFRLPGKGDNWWDVVHVDDVVSACLLLLERAPIGEVFHVVDDEPVTMKEFFARAAEALERKPWGHAPVWAAKLVKGSGPIVSAVRSAKSTNAKLKELGWQPRYPDSKSGLAAVAKQLAGGGQDEST
jgi:nucleoside-diphosphate-sugar epimerase